ncbi:phosphotransferase family protein [Streptomyces qinzhouensis]|uniref:Aminoglycoside phosphotransferase family protein n=1 Tax=Streptomyces qinzhouensis TaxID=2599401 RepID=A0A5B8J6B4_9ACTN|nr:aminoglycoside phosphotransferase family protein [Streptomyces qinzhouensis]QDY77345.1 aminoglycoside phosphotransferase family protein [Streptomyces qinzhouensis]
MHQPSALDAEAVRTLLSLDGTPVRRVAEGGEHATWFIGGDRVLRLAVDEDVTRRQRREIALRDALRGRLPVPVPGSLASGEWAPGLSYTLDNRLPGVSAEERPVSGAGELDLSGMLAALRSYAPTDTDIAAIGLPREPVREPAGLREAALRAARELAADPTLDPGLVLRRLDTAPPPAAPDTAVLLHNDLKGEHLLIGDDGGVTGVLDWTDAALGDPAEDIAGLALSIGAPAAVRAAALASYGPEVCLRGLWLARCDTLVRLADRLCGSDDSPLPLLRAQRRRAWQLTPLDL